MRLPDTRWLLFSIHCLLFASYIFSRSHFDYINIWIVGISVIILLFDILWLIQKRAYKLISFVICIVNAGICFYLMLMLIVIHLLETGVLGSR